MLTQMPNQRPSKTSTRPAASSEQERLYQLQATLAARVRSFRLQRRMSGVDLSKASGISKAMLSKIESGERLPSVPVLSALATGLGVGVGDLFGGPAAAFEPIFTPAGTGRPIPYATDDAIEFTGNALGSLELAGIEVSAMMCTLGKLDRPLMPVQFDGFWIDHVISGEIVVRVGSRDYRLKTGDTLTYRSEVPHSVVEVQPRARLLSIQGRILASPMYPRPAPPPSPARSR
ncbi:MAG: XRE family transcriptional regulator [Gammaproteobacteria bacterium]